MKSNAHTFLINGPTRPLLGRFVVFASTGGLPVGVIHFVAMNQTLQESECIARHLPGITREWSHKYPGIVWFHDNLMREPRLTSVAQSRLYTMTAPKFYQDFVGAPDPFPFQRLLYRSGKVFDECFLNHFGRLSGAHTVGGLRFKVEFVSEYFAVVVARLTWPIEWEIDVHVQGGPSAGSTATYDCASRDSEESLALLVSRLHLLVDGGHILAPLDSRITLRAARGTRA